MIADARLVLTVASSKPRRKAIDKDLRLFCSLGYPAYADPQLVLVFDPTGLPSQNRESTPWDSLGSRLTAVQVAHYTLPAPCETAYLARHFATCFDSVSAFIRGDGPTRPDPAGVFRTCVQAGRSQPELHTPEVTFRESVPADADTLLAVFANAAQLGETWKRTLGALRRLCQRCRAPYVPDPGPGGVRQAVSNFIVGRLAEEGLTC